jgi:hypothetical protein
MPDHEATTERGTALLDSIETLDAAGLRQALREAPLDGAAAVAIVARIAEIETARA